MAKDPAFLFYPGDYLRDTQNLSENAQVAYDRIMCEHMRNICITHKQHKFFTKRLNEDEKTELDMVLDKVAGGFQIEWVALSICKRKAYSESRRKNREGKADKICKTYDSHMENENENEDESKDGKENKESLVFDSFRKKHPGKKRENDTEFENFKKKHKDFKEVLPLLEPAIDAQIAERKILEQKKKFNKSLFIPNWKNLQTWIDQRCWEEETTYKAKNLTKCTYQKCQGKFKGKTAFHVGESYYCSNICLENDKKEAREAVSKI